jgi:hypothetical protein
MKAIQRGSIPLSELNLAGTNLCVTGLGMHAIDGLEIVCQLMRAPLALRVLDLRGTHLCGSLHDPARRASLLHLGWTH